MIIPAIIAWSINLHQLCRKYILPMLLVDHIDLCAAFTHRVAKTDFPNASQTGHTKKQNTIIIATLIATIIEVIEGDFSIHIFNVKNRKIQATNINAAANIMFSSFRFIFIILLLMITGSFQIPLLKVFKTNSCHYSKYKCYNVSIKYWPNAR